MCFYNDDYDWYAAIVEDETNPAEKPTKCHECHRTIAIGEPLRHVFQQEHEICIHDPASDHYDGFDEDDQRPDLEGCPDGCDHDFGETFDYDCCETCNQLIEAIHQYEIEVGCREDESRPDLTELYEAMTENDGNKYLEKAEAVYLGIIARIEPKWLESIRRSEE